jgi:hypothetical protein
MDMGKSRRNTSFINEYGTCIEHIYKTSLNDNRKYRGNGMVGL